MTFEKTYWEDSLIVEISLKTWVIEFEDGTEAKMNWLSEHKTTMDKIQYIEWKWYRAVVFDAPELDFAMLSLS